ncbi:hypothetical protein [Halorussus sp. MSC15.2]|uniref:hypothetical protein n=1 Tax=Halorussus sp. MSC15.2 TaxID=2283638 RepID=UPI00196781E4|nr:hypothetical protein [Halorussus sp. MSC15.2]
MFAEQLAVQPDASVGEQPAEFEGRSLVGGAGVGELGSVRHGVGVCEPLGAAR